MTELEGKHALVTGGGSGVGLSIVRALTNAGASVTITGRNKEALDSVAAESHLITSAVCDVTDAAAVDQLFASVNDDHGGADIVIANAGAAESVPFAKLSLADWNAMIDVNLTGVFLTMQAGLLGMGDKGWGRIVSIASVAGLKGYGYVAAYCAAKHGVVGLTRAVAVEVARSGITVNAVCPGYTQTPMLDRSLDNIAKKTGRSREEAAKTLLRGNPTGRFVEPEEVAQTVLWLCGPHSGAVTGQALSISGGEI
ncbi:MAG: SDR family oxidoreductase [Alphaproteobacteria bacterium]|nr:SDR family oxidoreductase [Alphaproteobacteria bacterium]